VESVDAVVACLRVTIDAAARGVMTAIGGQHPHVQRAGSDHGIL